MQEMTLGSIDVYEATDPLDAVHVPTTRREPGDRFRSDELIVGRYRIVKRLGKGGMGVVYSAEDGDLDRRVALKFLRPELRSQQDAVERFRQEARAMASVKHHNVVSVFAAGNHRGSEFIVTELIDGVSAEVLLRRARARGGHLDLEKTLRIVEQASRGLGAVHRAQLIHNDVKPSNLMVGNRTDRVVLMDFGLACHKANDDGVQPTFAYGTPAYLAPETIDSRQQSRKGSVKADIYALGATAYRLITSRAPIEARTFDELVAAHESQRPERPSRLRPDLPKGLDEVLLWPLRRDPDARPRRAEELGDALLKFIEPGREAPSPQSVLNVHKHPAAWRLVLSDPDPVQLAELVQASREAAPTARVVTSNSTFGALDLVRQVGADVLVVSDDEDTSGRAELARALTLGDELHQVHVIATTSRHDGRALDRLMSLGVDQMMSRPLRRDAVVSTLRSLRR